MKTNTCGEDFLWLYISLEQVTHLNSERRFLILGGNLPHEAATLNPTYKTAGKEAIPKAEARPNQKSNTKNCLLGQQFGQWEKVPPRSTSG